MDRYDPTTGHRRGSRHEPTLDAIINFRYLAPAKLARDEAHARVPSGLAPLPFVIGNDNSLGSPPLTEIVRQRLGAVLILIGTMLHGAHDVPEAIA